MNDDLIRHVIRRHSLEDAVKTLSQELNTSELTSILMHVFARRTEKVDTPAMTLAMSSDRFVQPSTISPAVYHAFDGKVWEMLPKDFEPIELSPLAPLGTVQSMAPVDSGQVVTTLRSYEVLSDPTNMLALIAAHRRRRIPGKQRTETHLSASHRVVRAQLPQHPGHTASFRLLSMISAGRDSGSYIFETRWMAGHIQFYLDLIRSFPTSEHVQCDVVIKAFADIGIEWDRIPIIGERDHVSISHQVVSMPGWSYYHPLRFQINLHVHGQIINIADGGMVNWTQRLLSDKKERLLISGLGTELFCKLFLDT